MNDPTRSLDEVADELYAMPPAGFVAARDEHASRATGAGQVDLARRLKKFRRPSQSAWLVNLLWRRERARLEELLGLAEAFREAQENVSGERLRELSTERQRLMSRLVRAAETLAAAEGVRPNADTLREVEATLTSALVEPEVAEQVRSGRLEKAVSYAGFGPAFPMSPEPPREREPVERPKKRTAPASKPGKAGKAAPDPAVERARQRLEDAREGVENAERDLRERETALQEATARRDELRDELDELRARTRDLEQQQSAMERGVRAEVKRRRRAEEELAQARRRLDAVQNTS